MTDAEIAAAWDAQASTIADAEHATGADDPVMTGACLDRILSELPPSNCYGDFLEIGCGIGRLTIPVVLVRRPRMMVAVDASPRMLEHARLRGCARGVGPTTANIQWLCASRPSLEVFAPGRYDFAWCALTFQHLELARVGEWVRATGRALRPGGRFVFQFIEGPATAADGPLSHRLSYAMADVFTHDGGMRVERASRGVGHPLWTWFTAVKF